MSIVRSARPRASRPAARSEVGSERLRAMDSLRGLAIVVVVLSHGWILWPIEWIDAHAWVRPVFRSGNFAVTIFFVATGFLVHRSLAAHGLANMNPAVGIVRRVLRVAPVVLVAVPAVIVAGALVDDPNSSSTNASTTFHVFTYTWNWYLQTDAIDSRWDLGHLWYLSVDMQAFVALTLLLYFVRRRPVAQVASLTGLLLLLTWWRMHVADLESVINVLLRTTARMDAVVVGVLLGVVLTFVPPGRFSQRALTWTGGAALVALVPLFWYCSDDARFLGWGVTLLELDVAVLLGSIALGGRVLTTPRLSALSFLGRHSLVIYVWHYPAFAAVEARTRSWDWPPRAAVALVVTAALCVATHYLLERHVARLLRHPAWLRLRPRTPVAPAADPRRDDLAADDLSVPVAAAPADGAQDTKQNV
ncbi:acyltransferase family protein [Nocardioides okcheonensis]|uniref:acyltransferase family protein n=1 Tax=Nocardioides okcheonensis TaxID=2894081 RepID=UPI001E5C0C58|nr:acyltransferase [Nocardioides okcheonensis]UFN44862.1 acyltransferase [Nocardioides okcheonensis]